MNLQDALKPARVARSLVSILVLTLLQTVGAPVLIPTFTTPPASAATETIAPGAAKTIVIPSGVFSISFTATGGGGGKGGNDGNTGKDGTQAGRVVATYAVEPGDLIGLYPGYGGVAGANSATNNGGGTGGLDTILDSNRAWLLDNSQVSNLNVGGGNGGIAGNTGSSGGGGGAGAASVVTINWRIVLIAAGGGGGGGAGNGSSVAQDWNGTVSQNGTSFTGGAGTAGNLCGNTDGGGGGGGGGGYYGGSGGAANRIASAECAGTQGSRGNNFASNFSAKTSDGGVAVTNSANGTILYDYTNATTSVCPTTSQDVDIYTVVKVSYAGTCTWSVPSTVSVIDFFSVGGGGGGGGDAGGGGGGGAVVSRTAVAVTASSQITLKVGGGGNANSYGGGGAAAGDSTVITLASGTTFTANGGSSGADNPGGAGGAGGVAVNGGFAGGAGGAGQSSSGIGAVGKTGASNFFYGVKNEYAGGGGGGLYANGTTLAGASGASGGGAGASAVSSSVNSPGVAGTNGTGGGGGGGVAAGTGFKISGGKGGSGVILIRYATNAADSFPVELANSLSRRFTPSDLQVLDTTRKSWIDSSGQVASAANSSITGTPTISTRGTTDGVDATGSNKTILVAKGGTGDRATLINQLNNNYTLFHVTRYVTGGVTGRTISSSTSGSNWLSGHYYNSYKCAHHEAWLTSASCNTTNFRRWLLSTDQLQHYRGDGTDVTLEPNNASYLSDQATATNVGVNNYQGGQNVDWELADLILFNKRLSQSEIYTMEKYLARIYGLTIEYSAESSESDTAVTFSGQSYRGFYKNDFAINDTFTVETWVKPASQCAGATDCAIFSNENTLVTKILNGTFWYALDGVTSRWIWINTNVKVSSLEWHHLAFSKRLPGNQANAIDLYLDGKLVYIDTGNPYTNGDATNVAEDKIRDVSDYYYIGARTDTTRFYGEIDEFKLWRVARTGSDIASDMHSNAVNSAGLMLYYDFNSNSLSNSSRLENLAINGPGRGYMLPSTTMTYVDVKVVAQTGPYTTVTFPRTYITQYGGWKVPVDKAATLIVAGGGGGAGKSAGDNATPGGSGGGGGVTYVPTQVLASGSYFGIKVGTGGLAATSSVNDATSRNGQSTVLTLPDNSFLTALGGGGGGSNGFVGAGSGGGDTTIATGGGGGGLNTSGSCSSPGLAGGVVASGFNGAAGSWGWGGAGGSARGAASNGSCTNTVYGAQGPGFIDSATSTEYGKSGFNGPWSISNADARYSTANNGWGGSVAYSGSSSSGVGRAGSHGVVIVRWITASRPTYTAPTNAFLNAGMTETFTVNVAQDSATAMLTRTFRWESSTAGAGGPFTTIKEGTGAANAFFAWVPTDTSTTGSNFLYRVRVTDSDTAGLFIQDTSTAVFAFINGALSMTGITSVTKTINVARSETFTVSSGTPGYRYTLSPAISGITLDTSTAGSAVIRISDTATVGTYTTTLTVIDSVSASVSIPLSITITAPPTLVNSGEIITQGQIFNIDPANSSSYSIATGTVSDISGAKKAVLVQNGVTYSNDYSGILTYTSGSSQYLSSTTFSRSDSWTVEGWIRLDVAPTAEFSILVGEYDGVNIPFSLSVDASRTIYAGFHKSAWTYKRSNEVIPIGVWTHLVGTYDGSNVNAYINGVSITVKDSGVAAGSIPSASTGRIYSNKSYATAVGTTASASYGPIRLYNVGFSLANVTQNYNATKDRFALANLNQVKPSQKYGALNVESFTVTSGGDTKTVSFAVGNRTGINWDTSTAGVINLSVQPTLTPGIYSDTITVTDNFGSSTNLPIRFTVSKADTLTILVETPTALNYTGNRALLNPVVRGIGAVGLESGTAISTTINYKPAGTTCATGGYCRVGDIGPGGGIVFIDTSTASSDGRIYEVAPQNWSGSDDLSTVGTYCSSNDSNIGAPQIGIGWGDTNTALARTSCLGGAVGRVNSFNLLNSTGYSDWFIPSRNEGIELAKVSTQAGLLDIGNNWNVGNYGYWGSTEVNSSTMSSIGHTGPTFTGSSNVSKSESTRNMVRPVRAFRSCWVINTCSLFSTTDTPTAAGVYMITPSAASDISTLQDRYTNVLYTSSHLTINRIAQRAQVIPSFSLNFPETFTVNVAGGDGNGAVLYAVTNGTATGCAFDYKKINSITAGSCNVTVVRTGDRNYLTDTATATLSFLLFVLSQPDPPAGSGPTIALPGATALVIEDPQTTMAPLIQSFSSSAVAVGQAFTITGLEFNAGSLQVQFSPMVDGVVNSSSATSINVTVPVGAESGPVSVITVNGMDFWFDFTVLPPILP